MTCTKCKQAEATMSGIVNGRYHSNLCPGCFTHLGGRNVITSGHADYERREQGVENGWMAAQPYMKDGTPSREFIALYPEKAKQFFDEDTMRKYS